MLFECRRALFRVVQRQVKGEEIFQALEKLYYQREDLKVVLFPPVRTLVKDYDGEKEYLISLTSSDFEQEPISEIAVFTKSPDGSYVPEISLETPYTPDVVSVGNIYLSYQNSGAPFSSTNSEKVTKFITEIRDQLREILNNPAVTSKPDPFGHAC